MKPARSILDPRFVYRNAACTNIRESFRRARLRIAIEAKQAQRDAQEATSKVTPLKRKGNP